MNGLNGGLIVKLKGLLRGRWPVAALGVSVTVACVLAGAAIAHGSSGGQQVLVTAVDMPAGQVVTEADVVEHAVSADAGLGLITAVQLSDVLGRAVATGIPAGTLLTENLLSETAGPAAGRAEVAVSLPVGRLPELPNGARVAVFVPGIESSTPTRIDAVVLATRPGDSGTAVVLEIAEADASMVALANPQEISIARVAPKGGE